MKTRIRLGKIEYRGIEHCTFFVDLHLKEKNGVLEFTASGLIESPDKESVYAVGQILDDPDIKNLNCSRGKELFFKIKDLWKKYHKNATNKGTKAQMEVLRELNLNQIVDFKKCCEALKERELFEVSLSDEEKRLNPEYANNPYIFGSGWIAEEIPNEDLDKIRCIMKVFNSTHNMKSALAAYYDIEDSKKPVMRIVLH